MLVCGDKPGKGRYVCRTCGKYVALSDTDVLKPCIKCHKCSYRVGA